MMKLAAVLAIAVTTLLATCAYAADVVSNFDNGTLQGWTVAGAVTGVSNPGSKGNPGGCLKLTDTMGGASCWAVAPAAFLGNWSNKVSISADLIQFSYNGSQSATARFQISGPGGVYQAVFTRRPGTTWSAFQANLNPTQWTRKSGSWDALLGNVTDFRVLMEFITGNEINGLDNVRLVDGALACTIAAAKQLPDGKSVEVTGIVTRVFAGFAYIQSEDNAAGIRVNGSLGVAEGAKVTLSGTLTTQYGERMLNGVKVSKTASGVLPDPVSVPVGSVGGVGQSGADPNVGSSTSPKNTGLLIRVTGQIVDAKPDGTFTIFDGGDTVAGICAASDVADPVVGSVVTLTGISSTLGVIPFAPAILLAHDEVVVVTLPLNANLLRNPGAEQGSCSKAGEMIRPIPGWAPTSTFTQTAYGYIYTTNESKRINGGRSFFFGGLSTPRSEALQYVDVRYFAALIDAKKITVKLSGWVGGRGTEGDRAHIKLTFHNAQGTQSSYVTMGPYAATNNTMIYREKALIVPAGTRTIGVRMIGVRYNGSNNDQYYDNLSLSLSK